MAVVKGEVEKVAVMEAVTVAVGSPGAGATGVVKGVVKVVVMEAVMEEGEMVVVAMVVGVAAVVV